MLPPGLAMFLAALAFQGEVLARCGQRLDLVAARAALAGRRHAIVGNGGDFEETMDRLEAEVHVLAVARCGLRVQDIPRGKK